MSLKFIGISQRIIENQNYFELREALAMEWGFFFDKNLENFLPLPLSYEIDFEKYLPKLSAVILSGGNDLYSLNPNKISKIRDCYEKNIIKHCLNKNIPIIGICRGAQIIASFFNSHIEKYENHTKEHEVYIDNKKIITNSFHNYAIKILGEDLKILAKAKDGTIEAFKHKNSSIYGIMWHIERKNGLNDTSIFKEWLKDIK